MNPDENQTTTAPESQQTAGGTEPAQQNTEETKTDEGQAVSDDNSAESQQEAEVPADPETPAETPAESGNTEAAA